LNRIRGAQERSRAATTADLSEWVRNLRNEQNVIAFVASNQGPGREVRGAAHRAFALAILNSTRGRPARWRGGPYTLNDFREVVREGVLALTRRQQFAECFIPETLNGRFPILDPRPAGR
jgi:hypothetical protein